MAMKKEARKKLIKGCIILLVVVVFFVAALIVKARLAPAPVSHAGEAVTSEELKDGTGMLKKLEQADPDEVRESIKEAQTKSPEDSDSEKTLKARFKGWMIMGDSRMEGVSLYKILDEDQVAAAKGHRLGNCSDDLEKVIRLKPDHIMISYGLNDIEIYKEHTEKYIEEYVKLISDLRKSLPDAEISVCKIIDVTDKGREKIPSLQYIPDYNKAIEAMCKEQKLTCIDGSSLVDEGSYEPDGMHMNAAFLEKWLTYVAEQAGL